MRVLLYGNSLTGKVESNHSWTIKTAMTLSTKYQYHAKVPHFKLNWRQDCGQGWCRSDVV